MKRLAWRKGLPTAAALRKAVVVHCGGCHVQHTGWPCNTCFHAAKPEGVTDDEWHALWQALLCFRGDYDREYDAKTETYHVATDIIFDLDGTFSHHVFADIPTELLRAQIASLDALLAEAILKEAL